MDDGRALDLSRRIAAARTQLEGSIQLLEESCSRLQEIRQQIRAGRSQRELLYTSGYARLQARLETMPVIEQAKGILMAQQRCGPTRRSTCCAGPPSVPTSRSASWQHA